MLSNLFQQVPELCTFANLDLQVRLRTGRCVFACVLVQLCWGLLESRKSYQMESRIPGNLKVDCAC
jgi:hypothetical protein